jgi:hypothetical protein
MKKIKFLASIALFALLSSCTEPYALQAGNFQDLLIMEGTITNELKNQEIKITRTIPIDIQQQVIVSNATVQVIDDSGTTYPFSLQDNSYKSNSPFQAVSGKKYKLLVQINGQSYESNLQAVPDESSIQSVTANVISKNNGNRGVSIAVSTNNASSNSKYYRYAYEETFIVKPPKWISQDIVYDNITNNFATVPRPIETSLCYSENNSAEIITTTTAAQQENNISNFEVLFLSDTDYKISYRYSVLVKQFLLNQDAYNYYNQTKAAQSSSGTTLSPTQPGFIIGNIKNTSNATEKVIGFFDVATVSEKRLFFNYADLFPNEPIPPYFSPCEIREFDISDPLIRAGFITNVTEKKLVLFVFGNPIFQMVAPNCGDCTSFSNPIKPSFWID